MIPVIVGALLAVGIAALAKLTHFDEDRSFYATVLVIIASYYVLFAVLGGSGHALVWELIIDAGFSSVAILARSVFSRSWAWVLLHTVSLILCMILSSRTLASRLGGQAFARALISC